MFKYQYYIIKKILKLQLIIFLLSNMDKGNTKKGKQHKNRNRDAVQFILANRDTDDPNYNNPDVNKKILLQVNKNEDLTEAQKKLINEIPEIERGIYDEEAKLKRLLNQEKKEENINKNEANHNNKKGVQFNFDKNEIINYDKKQKISQMQIDKLYNDIKNKKIDISKIEDEEKVNEIFKKFKINAKMVEYNELGVKKDTDPELLKFITDKEFVEGVDIFVPAPQNNNAKIVEDCDNDMKEENMNEEFKELENELKSDSENEKDKDNNKPNEGNKKSEDINTNSNSNSKINENEGIQITGDLEDDFVLLANGGELPIELLTEKEIKEEEKKKNESIKKNKENLLQQEGKPTYKYITPEEVEYVRKKFLEVDDDESKKSKKGNFISKQEFNDAINEILNAKKGKTDNKKETVMGLKKSILDEDEYEEYELSEEEEEEMDENEEKNKNIDKKEDKKEDKKNVNNNNIDNKKLKNIIDFKNKKKEDNVEEEEEEEDEDEGFTPNIKIEYVSKADEPDPFDTEKEKRKRKQKNKKEMKKSKTKQYEQLKAMGELSDESFDKEQLDEIIHEDNLVEKTKQMIENNIEIEKNEKELNQEIEQKYAFEPKVKKDITQVTDKVGNLPKSVKEVRKEKDFKQNKQNEKEEEKENFENKNENNQKINANQSRRDETKEEKKLRQKLVKMERKEKRAEKKKLKNAFKEEKVAQQKQIAQANKIVRYGLSVKDI